MKRLTLLAATGLLAACTSAPDLARLTGEVYYLPRIALPADAQLSVSLQDISRADAPAIVLARQDGPVQHQVPLPFTLDYDPQAVQPGHRYSVHARIEHQGRLLFITTEQHAVTLDGQDAQPLRVRVDPIR